MKNLIIVVLVSSMFFSLSAQNSLYNKKWNFEIGFGVNTFGPASEMNDLMIEYGYDYPSYNFFSGDDIQHPHYNQVGSFYQISFSYYINSHSRVGLQFSQSNLREIHGYSENYGHLFVRFSNMSFVPVYTYEIGKEIELQAGPALMINKGKTTSYSSLNKESYTKFSPGLMTGIAINLWNGDIIDGKLSVNYLFAASSKMGPFSSKNYDDKTLSIPESKIAFGHLNIGFVLGFHNYQPN